jgi:hypothetical protein
MGSRLPINAAVDHCNGLIAHQDVLKEGERPENNVINKLRDAMQFSMLCWTKLRKKCRTNAPYWTNNIGKNLQKTLVCVLYTYIGVNESQ